jgi:hypothetical protein
MEDAVLVVSLVVAVVSVSRIMSVVSLKVTEDPLRLNV